MTVIADAIKEKRERETRIGTANDIEENLNRILGDVEYNAGWAEEILGKGEGANVIADMIIKLHQLRKDKYDVG
jgi:hypothetical protein